MDPTTLKLAQTKTLHNATNFPSRTENLSRKARNAFSSRSQRAFNQTGRIFDNRPQPHTPNARISPISAPGSAKPIWVPPKDCSAKNSPNRCSIGHGPFCVQAQLAGSTCVSENHRSKFTQVRDNSNCPKLQSACRKAVCSCAVIPNKRIGSPGNSRTRYLQCVTTRLEEFLDGPGKQKPGQRSTT